jgi:hypothetical protein
MLFDRIVGVFRLSVPVFEDIEHDRTATGQAALVVAGVALLLGLGSGFTRVSGVGGFTETFISTFIWAFIGWLIWSGVSYFVGTTFFGGQADLGEMLRVIGFASAPLALGIIPCIGGLVGALWAMAAGFVAVRQGLDLDNLRALLTVGIGFVLYLIGYLVLLFGGFIFGQLFGLR